MVIECLFKLKNISVTAHGYRSAEGLRLGVSNIEHSILVHDQHDARTGEDAFSE